MGDQLRLPRSPQTQIAMLLHGLLLAIVAASVLTFWGMNHDFLNPSGWYSPEYFKQDENIQQVPGLVRALKDLFALLLLGASLWFNPTNPNRQVQRNVDLKILYGVGLALVAIGLMRTLTTTMGLTLALATLRPLVLSGALFVFCHRHLNPAYLRWVFEALTPLALLQVYYAYEQRQNSIDWHGVSFWSRGQVRSVGTFAEPNTMGLFLALVVYLNVSVLPPHPLRYGLVAACSVTMVYFADSRTAALLVAMVLALELYRHVSRLDRFFRNPVVIGVTIVPSLLGFSYWVLGQITATSVRGGGATGGRLDAVVGAVKSSGPVELVVGKYLGAGSNILQVLDQAGGGDDTGLILSDSTLAALINQVGLLGVLVFLGILYILLKLPTDCSALAPQNGGPWHPPLRQERAGLIACLLLVGLTSVLFEFYVIWALLVPLMFPWQWQAPDYQASRFYLGEIYPQSPDSGGL